MKIRHNEKKGWPIKKKNRLKISGFFFNIFKSTF